jgi:hypothetical protein
VALGSPMEIERRFEQSQNDLVLQTSDFSLQGLKEMVDDSIIDLSPKYQRRERWQVDRQSELIESFLLNVPVPPIYLAEEEYGIYSIIDGKQRITAVADYLNNSFALKGLSEFHELNGARFRDLPKTLQSALRVRPYLRVITLLKQSHPRLKYEVFIRLNRGGISLNNQEIRNVAFRGPLNDAIYIAGENTLLRDALKIEGPKSAAFQQMQDAEYVLRFLTLNSSWDRFSGSLSKSMDEFMLEHREADAQEAGDLIEPFNEAIDRTAALWGEVAFQRWDGTRWRQQALAGLYDAQMIAATLMTDAQIQVAATKQNRIVEATRKLFSDSDFEETVRIGTNTPSRIKSRIERVYNLLLDFS